MASLRLKLSACRVEQEVLHTIKYGDPMSDCNGTADGIDPSPIVIDDD